MFINNNLYGKFDLPLYGEHQLLDALAVITICYLENLNVPAKIMCEDNIEDREIIEELLSQKNGRKIEIKVPKKGEKLNG